MPVQTAALYNDFGALASLRLEARQDADAALESVAAQFESLFLQMMLKSMRDALPEGGLFNSNDMQTYRDMADRQMAVDLSAEGGIGLADVLVRQLRGGAVGAPESKSDSAGQPDADAVPGMTSPAASRLGVEPARLLRELELGTPDAGAGALKNSSGWSLSS